MPKEKTGLRIANDGRSVPKYNIFQLYLISYVSEHTRLLSSIDVYTLNYYIITKPEIYKFMNVV